VTTPGELPNQTYETQNPVEPEAESQTIETRKEPLPTPADPNAGDAPQPEAEQPGTTTEEPPSEPTEFGPTFFAPGDTDA
jgi:hypothetical protein